LGDRREGGRWRDGLLARGERRRILI